MTLMKNADKLIRNSPITGRLYLVESGVAVDVDDVVFVLNEGGGVVMDVNVNGDVDLVVTDVFDIGSSEEMYYVFE